MKRLYLLIGLSLLPFLSLLFLQDTVGSFTATAANLTGFIAGILLTWELLIGIRFIAHWFTRDYSQILTIHKLLGIYSMIFVLLHPIIELFVYYETFSFLYRLEWNSTFATFMTLGRIAFLLILGTWISSSVARRFFSYRVWKYVHYLSYPAIILMSLHSLLVGSFLQAYPLLWGYWLIWLGAALVAIVYRVYRITTVLDNPYILTAKKTGGNNVTLYSLKPQVIDKIPKPGQFVYLKTSFWSEAHPFSVVQTNHTTGEIILGVQAVGPFTKKLQELKKGSTLYIDGPYGAFTTQGQNNPAPKIIVAGGIGIAPFIEFIQKHANENTYLLYANRYKKDALYTNQLRQRLETRYIDVLSREEGTDTPTDSYHRLNEHTITAYIPTELHKTAQWFICASPSFTQHVLDILTTLQIPPQNVFIEAYEF